MQALRLSKILVSTLLVIGGVACNDAHFPLSDASLGPTVTYDGQVQALFQNRCSYCHNQGSTIPNWLNYNVAFSFKEAIYQKVVVEKSMPMAPYDKAMTDSDRKLVGEWIQEGAQKNGGTTTSAPPPAPPGPPLGVSYTFKKDIEPLFVKRCSLCHTGSPLPNWTDYKTAFANRGNINQHVFVNKDMPQNNMTQMTDTERLEVAQWVQAGAPEGDGPDPTPKPNSGYAVTYDDVKPIFTKRCVECHTPGALFDWLDYNEAYYYRDDLYKDVYIHRIMPKYNQTGMTDAERKQVGDWVAEGAPSGSLTPIPSGAKVTYAPYALEIFAKRCALCHYSDTDPTVPNWLNYATAQKFSREIEKRTAYDRTDFDGDMPPKNITGMTLEERDRIRKWVSDGASK